MGFFSFLKSVGQKLTGGDDTPKPEELKKELDSHEIGTQKVEVAVEGDTVVLSGEVAYQEALEKAGLAVGNTTGIAAVNTDSLKVLASAPEAVFYEVQKGDNLWKIAEANYGKGHGDKYNVIFEANKPMLKDPDKIYPGQKLRIPPLQ